MRATSAIAEFVVKSRWEECPEPAVAAARRAILACLGVVLAGSVAPPARIVQSVARAEGGAPLATVVGTGQRPGAVWAALCNGTAAHALDFDDTNFALLGHPSAPVLAAALAAGELALADGRAVVHAFLLGFEVETTLAEVVNPEHYDHGWHATCTLGTLGAAAAAARPLGLGAGPTRVGRTASEQALEGPQGWVSVLGAGARRLEALATLGAPWKILTTGVAVKPYPSCACTHSIIDGTLELKRVHGLLPEQVAEITVGINAIVPKILIHHEPHTGLEAKFSAEFSAAAALCEERVGIGTFRDDTVRNPAIRA